MFILVQSLSRHFLHPSLWPYSCRWSPQGSIAMHLPEKWGMLQFSAGPVNATPAVYNPEWPLRSVAAQVYYAQHAYGGAHNGSYTSDITQLLPYVDGPYVLNGSCTSVPQITLTSGGKGFIAWSIDPSGTMAASITDDRYMRVFHGAQAVADIVAHGPGLESLPPSRRRDAATALKSGFIAAPAAAAVQ